MSRFAIRALVIAPFAAACFSEAPTATPVDTPPPATGTVDALPTSNVFSPQTITIARGGAVTWTFGTRPHNVTFVATTGAPQNVPTTTNGQAARTFATAGTFAYACTLHAGMVGTVVVK